MSDWKKCSQICLSNREVFAEVPFLQKRNFVFKLLDSEIQSFYFTSNVL